MALFRRRQHDPADSHELPGLSSAETEAFMDALGAELDALGAGWSVVDGALRLEGDSTEYGLTRVAQQWQEADPANRRDLLRDRLARLGGADDPPEIAPADMPALARPQLWAMEDVMEVADAVIAREIADDLAVVLSVDLPTAVLSIGPDDVRGTGMTEDKLWQRAMAQLDDGEPIERRPLDDAGLVEVLVSDSHFLATQVLALEALLGPLPDHGALVAVPHRHMIALHVIQDATVLDAVGVMAPFTVEHFEEGPGSLSPHRYWWHDRRLELIRVDDDDGSIYPPPSFVAMVETLPDD